MKYFILLIMLVGLFLSGCTSDVQEETPLVLEEPLVVEEEVENIELQNDSNFQEFMNDIKFNQNLSDYEKEWLGYLEVKYPKTKIFHMKTKLIKCEGCYDLSYKKDREVVIIQVRDFKKTAEKKVVDDIAVEIENADICKLFQGNWNDCPKLCNTDEEACKTECGFPVCEFDYNTITFRALGEECGGLDKGDCEFGLRCVYSDRSDDYGICQE